MVCGIFLDQGSNLCPLHWQLDSHPLALQKSPPFLPFLKDFAYVLLATRTVSHLATLATRVSETSDLLSLPLSLVEEGKGEEL